MAINIAIKYAFELWRDITLMKGKKSNTTLEEGLSFIHSFSSQLETLNHQNKSETIKAVKLIEFFNNFAFSFHDKYLKLI